MRTSVGVDKRGGLGTADTYIIRASARHHPSEPGGVGLVVAANSKWGLAEDELLV
jgi:hypothetical protein